METPVKMDDLEGKPPIFGNIQFAGKNQPKCRWDLMDGLTVVQMNLRSLVQKPWDSKLQNYFGRDGREQVKKLHVVLRSGNHISVS